MMNVMVDRTVRQAAENEEDIEKYCDIMGKLM